VDIVHIYKDYYPVLGGIENHVRVLAEAQAAAGHSVTVLACALGRRTTVEERQGVRVVKAGRLATVASMPISLSQPAALARLEADIAHIQSPYPLGEAANWILGKARATVITHQSDVVRQRLLLRLYAPVLRRILRACDLIIATSGRYVETSPWLRPVADSCRVVPLGVDLTRFTPAARPPPGPVTALFVGRLRYYKGLDTLLEALARLPEVCVEIVGDGPMRAELERQAEELGVAGRTRFVGEAGDEELPSVYRRAHLFVLPANARAEAFGSVLLEAMASGLPCVTTEVGTGTSWVVQDGLTGVVVPPRNPAALADAIRSLAADPRRRAAMGEAGRRRVEQDFTTARMIEGVEAVYAEALSARPV
jgi:glycosyltransferase involved in cell wall biosynthesis